MRIVAIDPGLRVTGYACLEQVEGGVPIRIVEAGCLRLNARHSVADRLQELDDDLRALLARVDATHGAVEQVFSHVERPGPAIVMGHARGVILLALRQAQCEILELPPATVKKALTGKGRASKEQVARAVALALDLPAPPTPHDVSDAMAIGIAGLARLTRAPQPATVESPRQ